MSLWNHYITTYILIYDLMLIAIWNNLWKYPKLALLLQITQIQVLACNSASVLPNSTLRKPLLHSVLFSSQILQQPTHFLLWPRNIHSIWILISDKKERFLPLMPQGRNLLHTDLPITEGVAWRIFQFLFLCTFPKLQPKECRSDFRNRHNFMSAKSQISRIACCSSDHVPLLPQITDLLCF